MTDPTLYRWMPEFYADDMYWLVTVEGLARAVFLLEADARAFFAAIDPNEADGDVHLWRLNGGHLCRPHVAVRSAMSATLASREGEQR